MSDQWLGIYTYVILIQIISQATLIILHKEFSLYLLNGMLESHLIQQGILSCLGSLANSLKATCVAQV